MFCGNCGSKFGPNQKFCAECGVAIEASPSKEATTPSPVGHLASATIGVRTTMICPTCHAEYRAGFTECPDCKIQLIAPPEPLLKKAIEADSRIRALLWPTITDLPTAKRAARQGFWAAIWNAVGGVVIAGIVMFGTLTPQAQAAGFDAGMLIDAVVFAIIGFGIYKLSRVAAIAGLCLYLLERIDMWISFGPRNPIMAAVITLMFANSVRGTMTFHRLSRKVPTEELTKPTVVDGPP